MQWLFGRRRNTLPDSGILHGMTDWHSHILPGVDDGVQTKDEALSILELYESLGIHEVWLTPHIMEEIPNETSILRTRFTELLSSYTGNIVLHLASENMLDCLFMERLSVNDLLPLGCNGDHLLVETSYYSPPSNLWKLMEDILSSGYCPVLAHPERYAYMNDEDYKRLKDMGILFQLNFVSLTGLYGSSVRKRAERLLKISCYDVMGSDIHSFFTHSQQLKVRLHENVVKLMNFSKLNEL